MGKVIAVANQKGELEKPQLLLIYLLHLQKKERKY